MRLIIFTCRVDVQGLEQFVRVAKNEKCILTLWHNRLTILPEILKKYAPQFVYCAFISKSRDGELLDILIKSYSIGRTLRVPHNARHLALYQMIGQLKEGKEIMVLTPDGPRGPRYEVKPGVIIAAKQAGASIIPLSWSSSWLCQLKSWDKLMFPLPFSRLVVTFGDPILLGRESENQIGEDSASLKQTLTHLDMHACATITRDPKRWPK